MNITNLSYAQSPMVKPYLYCTIPDRIRNFATERPSKPAFIIHSVSRERDVVTWNDVYTESLAFTKGLVQLGINKGDTVGVALENSRHWLVSSFGIQFAGAVPLCMVYKYKDGRDIIPTLKDTGNCKAIIINRRNDLIAHIVTSSKTDQGKTEVSSECLPALKFIVASSGREQDCMTFPDVVSYGTISNNRRDIPKIDPDDIAAFFLTSGSTGLPKLVPKTHFQILALGQRAVSVLGITTPSDVYFSDRLFNWIGGYPIVNLISGGTHVTSTGQFTLNSVKDISEFATTVINFEKCTVAFLLPAFILEILKKKENEFHVRTICTGGVPIPKECSDVVGRVADEFIALYGSTEMHYVSNKKIEKQFIYSSYCIGRPNHGVEMKIVDSAGRILKRNQTGELYVRNRLDFNGYHNNIAKTNEVLDANGWYKTDDSAYMDENGDVFAIGRCSDIIMCYEQLIAPSVIEDEIREHPSVEEVCAVPISDPICFQKICACIVLGGNSQLTEGELKTFLSSGKHTVPYKEHSRVYLFFENLPKTAVGKIFRKGVKEAAEKRLAEK